MVQACFVVFGGKRRRECHYQVMRIFSVPQSCNNGNTGIYRSVREKRVMQQRYSCYGQSHRGFNSCDPTNRLRMRYGWGKHRSAASEHEANALANGHVMGSNHAPRHCKQTTTTIYETYCLTFCLTWQVMGSNQDISFVLLE